MTTPAEFERVLRRPALHRDGPFALHVCPAESGGGVPGWRLGLVIPKRYEASAVARNTIKRRWRDAFRRGRTAWADEFGSIDLVVRLQSPLVPKPAKAGKGASATSSRAAGSAKSGGTPAIGRSAVAGRTGRRVDDGAARSAKSRARTRFDPSTMLTAMAERLRRRMPGPPVTKASS